MKVRRSSGLNYRGEWPLAVWGCLGCAVTLHDTGHRDLLEGKAAPSAALPQTPPETHGGADPESAFAESVTLRSSARKRALS